MRKFPSSYDGGNDIFDDTDGNFDAMMMEMTKKHKKTMDFKKKRN